MLWINYMPRATLAQTSYVEISEDDMEVLKAVLLKAAFCLLEGSNPKSAEAKAAVKDLYKPTEKLPRGRNNLNSCATIIGGILNNLLFTDQTHLTDRQLQAIEFSSAALHCYIEEIPAVRFKLGLL